ncbi:hypothetical protein BC940DRAFT_312984 [Gongronella butleri]|nr:hypothetical protein BC940DRAFT_312984 [Gongronella butleri]
MNAIDFLSSDIEFPCDSNEPKLSAQPCTKLPDAVDWSVHDFYSTVLEKSFAPLASMTDIRHLEPVKEEAASTLPHYGGGGKKEWKEANIFAVDDKQDDPALVVVLTKGRAPSPLPAVVPEMPSHKDQLRNALRGAFDLVEEKIEREEQQLRPSSSCYNKDLYLSWPDVILAESLHTGTFDQDLWDDEAQYLGPPSPAYHAINDNPILDSSLPSRISSIMPLSSIQPPIASSPSPAIPTTTAPACPSPLSAPVTNDAPLDAPETTTCDTKTPPPPMKRWNVWQKMKQVTQPIKRSIKTKNVFRRLFQH